MAKFRYSPALPPATGRSWQAPQNVTLKAGPRPSETLKRRFETSRPRSKVASCVADALGRGAPSGATMPSATAP